MTHLERPRDLLVDLVLQLVDQRLQVALLLLPVLLLGRLLPVLPAGSRGAVRASGPSLSVARGVRTRRRLLASGVVGGGSDDGLGLLRNRSRGKASAGGRRRGGGVRSAQLGATGGLRAPADAPADGRQGRLLLLRHRSGETPMRETVRGSERLLLLVLLGASARGGAGEGGRRGAQVSPGLPAAACCRATTGRPTGARHTCAGGQSGWCGAANGGSGDAWRAAYGAGMGWTG